MGKPITEKQTSEFREFCRSVQGEDGGYFTLEMFEPFSAERKDGEPLWEFHARNYNPKTSHDIYKLFESVKDEFTIEQHQYDEFYAIPTTQETA